MRLLLAEDNPVNRTVVIGLLARRGWLVDVAANGREAVGAIARAHADGAPYDLVLMDVQMPEMDGLEATARIRSLESERGLPRVPIVAVTAHAMAGDRERCLAAGMDGHVAKPLRLRELDEAIAATRAAGDLGDWGRRAEDGGTDHAPPSARERMLGLLDADESLLRELAAVFLADLPGLREALADAVRRADDEAMRRVAHRVKGSAAVFGADAAVSHAAEAERRAAAGDRSGAATAIAALLRALDSLEVALRAL